MKYQHVLQSYNCNTTNATCNLLDVELPFVSKISCFKDQLHIKENKLDIAPQSRPPSPKTRQLLLHVFFI